jgi:hypothetical protein
MTRVIIRKEKRDFYEMREEFHPQDTHPARLLIQLGYLVPTFGNCTMKLCIETGLRSLNLASIYSA